MLNFILALICLILLVLGITVYYANPKSRVNLSLSAFIFSGILWILANIFANYYLDNNTSNALIFSRLTLVGAVVLPFTYILFSHFFSDVYDRITKGRLIIYALPLALLIFTFSDFNIRQAGNEIIIGPLYYILIPIILLYFIYGTFLLAIAYKTNSAIKRLQLQYIFFGIVLSVIPGLIFNAILPLLGHIEASYFGPAVVMFFAVFTSLAIIKHDLLNIKLLVVRSTAYILLASSLIGIYVLIVFGLANNLIGQESVFAQQIIPIAMALFLVVTAPFLKKFFDKATNQLFYRDAYDTQDFIDELNRGLVNDIELGILLRHTSHVIEKHLKCSFCLIGVNKTDTEPIRVIGAQQTKIDAHDVQYMGGNQPNPKRKFVISDDIDIHKSKFKKFLEDKFISMIVNLRGSSNSSGPATAYLILGPKKSGNIYNKQDLKIIEIVADELVIAIQNALRFEEIQGFAATLQQEVNQATTKLKRTNKKLRALDETKDEFISMASHQLRTPLTSVKGYLSMILDGDAGPLKANQKKLLSQAFISTQRTTYLISDLLNVSRIKTGRFIVETYDTDLVQVAAEEVEQFEDEAKNKNIKLVYQKPKSFPHVMADEPKIRQVIANFIDNSIDYTPKGGRIQVKLGRISGNVYLKVIDNGIGVPIDQQRQVFSKFFRASNAKRVRPDGIGLGLFMVKKVIDGHRGSILFESTENKGSTFGFTLPIQSSKVSIRKQNSSKKQT